MGNDKLCYSSRANGRVRGIATLSAPVTDVVFRLVRAFLQTSYYLYPFLHLPTFLQVRSARL
jgi:hypothetical protein